MDGREARARITESLDVFGARRKARELAAAIGFNPTACLEIAIVVSELATNIVKYGVRGEIVMRKVVDPTGIELVAEDEGPPVACFATAVRDGYGDRGPIEPDKQLGRGGIGAGLGAVMRLTDQLEYRPGPGRKAFRAVRYLVRPRKS
jgi:anti-sigma regulatory factor (Ser/Thr protein kinase)